MSATPTVLAVVQAGGKGSRMDVLTRERAKPTLPFGGCKGTSGTSGTW